MRPFLSLSLPDVPSYEEFNSLVSVQTSESRGCDWSASQDGVRDQAISMLDIAEQAMKVARREWDTMSKQSAAVARCQGCEDWWKSSIRDVPRAAIAGNIAGATTRKGLGALGGRHMKDVLKVEVPDPTKRYHTWWAVPNISLR